jgi:phage antirepressor YoqD-like protein
MQIINNNNLVENKYEEKHSNKNKGYKMDKIVTITKVVGSDDIIINSTFSDRISSTLLQAYIKQLALEEQEIKKAKINKRKVLIISRDMALSQQQEKETIFDLVTSDKVQIRDFIKTICTPENSLKNIYKILREKNILMDSRFQWNYPKEIFINRGLFEVEKYDDEGSIDYRYKSTTYITQKGMSWMVGQLFEWGLINETTLIDYFNPVIMEEDRIAIIPKVL